MQPSAVPQQARSAPPAGLRMEMHSSGQVPRPGSLMGPGFWAREGTANVARANVKKRVCFMSREVEKFGLDGVDWNVCCEWEMDRNAL